MRPAPEWSLRLSLFLPLLLPLLLRAAVADGPPPTVEQSADRTLEAIRAGNAAALQTLAAKEVPDPWLVVDELCSRGEHDAAEAFAKAAPRADVKGLSTYVQGARQRGDDKSDRALLVAMSAALAAREPQRVLDETEAAPPAFDTVVRVRLRGTRAAALAALGRLEHSADAWEEAAAAAAALGWIAQAGRFYAIAGNHANRASAWPKALSAYEKAHELAERRGDRWRAASTLGDIGNVLLSLAHYPRALAAFEEARLAMAELGDKASEARMLGNIGTVQDALGDRAQALVTLEQALAAKEALGDRSGTATTLANIGNVHASRGDYSRALAAYARALELKEALGDQDGVALVLGNLGFVQYMLGDYPLALATLERALAAKESLGARSGAAWTLTNLASVHWSLGDYAKALATYQRALAIQEAVGNKQGAAKTLSGLGNVYLALGDYAQALAMNERSLALMEELGDKSGAATALGNLGVVYSYLGDRAKALAIQQRALAAKEAVGDMAGAARTLSNIADALWGAGDQAKALSAYERALATMEAVGDRVGAAWTLGELGSVHLALGDLPKALASAEQALATLDALGDKQAVAWVLGTLGRVHLSLGDPTKARTYLERSARAARSLRATPLLVGALSQLARLHLETDHSARALGVAREALTATEDLLGGLDAELGATARLQHVDLFAIGTLAAVREEDVPEALRFLESGRAGALLDALDKREVLRWKAESLPPDLRRLDLEATARENAARQAHARAVAGGDRRATRAALQALDEATEAAREVEGRIQRELKQQAGLFYPRARTLEQIQGAMDDDQALVLYGLCLDEALALVVRPDGERVVTLGTRAAIEAACETTGPRLAAPGSQGDSPPSPSKPGEPEDAAAALAGLRSLLVEPLALGDDVKQVLVSPEGPLCYLPFGALFPQIVTLTPSGTTHALLLEEERTPGDGILALGDPDYAGVSEGAQALYYGGRRLAPLPATRREAETIGTRVLCGAEASERGLVEALGMAKRWRAVHFACHGLVDVERPMLSSLALSRAGEDDGFLTALEVLHRRIPADLAVLSACETGKGRIVGGEGIVGLARAFMFAGTPRVICSLWKVDDEATQALMLRFYELWHPRDGAAGLPAAEALRRAQEHVRSQARWEHPYYWAAWVLWGLP